jgi:hypothetical protein
LKKIKFLGIKSMEARNLVPPIPFCTSNIECQLSIRKEKAFGCPTLTLTNNRSRFPNLNIL